MVDNNVHRSNDRTCPESDTLLYVLAAFSTDNLKQVLYFNLTRTEIATEILSLILTFTIFMRYSAGSQPACTFEWRLCLSALRLFQCCGPKFPKDHELQATFIQKGVEKPAYLPLPQCSNLTGWLFPLMYRTYHYVALSWGPAACR